MRAVLPRIPVRPVGRQDAAGCAGRGDAGVCRRGMTIPSILLIGCGRMGSAMLSGWREQGLERSIAVDPAAEAAQWTGSDLSVVADVGVIPAGFAPAAVVFAVKPQNAA